MPYQSLPCNQNLAWTLLRWQHLDRAFTLLRYCHPTSPKAIIWKSHCPPFWIQRSWRWRTGRRIFWVRTAEKEAVHYNQYLSSTQRQTTASTRQKNIWMTKSTHGPENTWHDPDESFLALLTRTISTGKEGSRRQIHAYNSGQMIQVSHCMKRRRPGLLARCRRHPPFENRSERPVNSRNFKIYMLV